MAPKPMHHSSPDTLQDLCIFYCVNNLQCLTNSLANWKDADDDSSSVFSLLLGNKLLEYYINTSIPCEDSKMHVDQLLQNSQLCNSLQLNRKGMLSLENVFELSINTIKHLDLTVFGDSAELQPGLEYLIDNNLTNLVTMRLQNKSDDSDCVGLLEALCNVKSDEDEAGSGDTGSDVQACQGPANQKFSIKKLDGEASLPAQEVLAVRNLKSFSYIKSFFSNYGELKLNSLLQKVLENNHSLHSVSFVSAVCYPFYSYLSEGAMHSLQNLTFLVLSSDAPQKSISYAIVSIAQHMFEKLPNLQHLQHLDLSYGVQLTSPSPKEGMLSFAEEHVQAFKKALLAMPQLKSLDISGTTLTEIVGHEQKGTKCTSHCMPGFDNRRFHYLGLYFSDSCFHEYIPANKISGTNSEEQLLVALWSHQHNKTIMYFVLKEIHYVSYVYCVVRSAAQTLCFLCVLCCQISGTNSEEQLLVALWSHQHNKTIMYFVLKEIQIHINAMQSNLQKPTALFEGMVTYLEHTLDWELNDQASGNIELKNIENIFVNMYYLLRYKVVQKDLSLQWKRKLLDCVIVICNNCARDIPHVFGPARETMLQVSRVSLLIVMILVLENITVYSYCFEKYVRMLIRLMRCNLGTQRTMLVLRLLHSACRLGQNLKVVAGQKLNLVQTLLSAINDILFTNGGNLDILGKMWSILWTLTDEVPTNCELFVDNGGCQICLASCETTIDDDDLRRKVSGAMCNVSEVAHLRPRLMTEPLVTLFRKLLGEFTEDNYDITSHAAAYLVLLAADGPEAWMLEHPTRDEVVQDIDRVIRDHWDISKPKGVKFRSLTPMMDQLMNFCTPTAQYWGAWMICNLVIVKPERYCPMVINENGLELMARALEHDDLRQDVRDLMTQVRETTLHFLREGGSPLHIAD